MAILSQCYFFPESLAGRRPWGIMQLVVSLTTLWGFLRTTTWLLVFRGKVYQHFSCSQSAGSFVSSIFRYPFIYDWSPFPTAWFVRHRWLVCLWRAYTWPRASETALWVMRFPWRGESALTARTGSPCSSCEVCRGVLSSHSGHRQSPPCFYHSFSSWKKTWSARSNLAQQL